MAYTTPEDIANRALQHCGVPPSNRIVSLSEVSKNAKEIVACYDGIRKAELRSTPWRFAIRRAVLRPVSATTVTWTPPAWAVATAYGTGAIVSYNTGTGSKYWLSSKATTGDIPGSNSAWVNYFGPLNADDYSATTTYMTGDLVMSSSVLYFALAGSINQTPVSSPTYWSAQAGTTVATTILYPLRSGPVSEVSSDNAYPLPYGWLANTDQEASTGVTTNLVYSDWRVEGDYIVTRETQPIILRFIADVVDPIHMDPMFCEAFAARIGVSICESITQAKDKIEQISAVYRRWVDEAKGANGIEVGAPPTGDGFAVPEDIANRALQYCGLERISSFAENSREARETRFCYNKLREAELRRNVWNFSIRHAVLRPIDLTTRLWTAPAYVNATTYLAGEVVSFDDGLSKSLWISKLDANTGNIPIISPVYWENYFGPIMGQPWDSTLTYSAGDIAYLNAGDFYLSLNDTNTDNPSTSAIWVPLLGTTSSPLFPSPIFQKGYVFPLPYGWLRNAPQDPKIGSYTVLGAPSNNAYDDWIIENNFIITRTSGPIMLRFAANVRSVPSMHSMFCEGLAARIAISVFTATAMSTIVTAPDGKQSTQPPSQAALVSIWKAYDRFMAEARTGDGIESGPIEPPLDDYLAVRA